MELWRGRESLSDDAPFMAAFAEAWRLGRAHAFVLDTTQQQWCQRREGVDSFSVWMLSRQLGKSFAAIMDDCQYAERTPGAICRYLGQTGESALAIFGPTMDQIMAMCPLPKRERPYPYNKDDTLGSHTHMRWENGAELILSGTDNDTFRRQRGPRSHRITYDEAGFYPKLVEVQEALNPSLQTTGGSPLYVSTPPISPGHPFVELYEAASAIGRSEHGTIYENPRLTPVEIEKVIERAAAEKFQTVEVFKKSTYFRREYMAQVCLDSSLAVLPEFPDARDGVNAPSIIVAKDRAPHFDIYISADPGMGDLTGILFAVTDFRAATLDIEHELLFQGANTATIAREVFAVLEAHYGVTLEMRNGLKRLARNSVKPWAFVIDDDQEQVVTDLAHYHGIEASKAIKDDSEAAINVMRLELPNLRIHPRCVHLIRQAGNAVRKSPGGEMTRSPRDGHWDLIAALKYLVRAWDKRHNPYPADYGFDARTQARREPAPRTTLGDVMLRGTSLGRRR